MGKALSQKTINDLYGDFTHLGANFSIEKESVPETLLDLLPYAEFWGFIDDSQRQELVSKASREVLSDLKERVSVHDEELDSWLGGPEAQSPNPSNAYLAFSAMRMVADLSVQK